MIHLQGPVLELGYYLPACPPRDAFLRVVGAALQEGARVSGHVAFSELTDPRFDWVSELETEEVVLKAEEVLPLCERADRFVVELGVYGASGLNDDRLEAITYVGLPKESVAIDRHPIAILTEGYDLDQPGRSAARKAGRMVFERFSRLVEHIRPAYAAITGEWSLNCLSALRVDPRTIAFRDCYISKAFVGEASLQRILKHAEGAFIQPLADGVCISAWEVLNPMRVSFSSTDCQVMSERIARELGTLWDKRRPTNV